MATMLVATSETPSLAPSIPPLGRTMHPFSKTPNWGTMHSAALWERPYDEMTDDDFVPVPAYDLSTLTRPLNDFLTPFREDYVPAITMKLYYSTIYCSPYTVNPTGEYTGSHCAVDLKVADGTPFAAIGGGRVADVRSTSDMGVHVLIEHRLPDGTRVVSIYGHMQESFVRAGQDVKAGSLIGTVGMTGNTSGPHLHLQIDVLGKNEPASEHQVVAFGHTPSSQEANQKTLHPIRFIEKYSQ
jgi:murein DD-endopeptidase MepM/ murein hydrolase activator NlpD